MHLAMTIDHAPLRVVRHPRGAQVMGGGVHRRYLAAVAQPGFRFEAPPARTSHVLAEHFRRDAVGMEVELGEPPIHADLPQTQGIPVIAKHHPALGIRRLLEKADEIDMIAFHAGAVVQLVHERPQDIDGADAGAQRQHRGRGIGWLHHSRAVVQGGAESLLHRRLAPGATPAGTQLPQGLQATGHCPFHRKRVNACVQQLAGTLHLIGERDLRIGGNISLAQVTVIRPYNLIATLAENRA